MGIVHWGMHETHQTSVSSPSRRAQREQPSMVDDMQMLVSSSKQTSQSQRKKVLSYALILTATPYSQTSTPRSRNTVLVPDQQLTSHAVLAKRLVANALSLAESKADINVHVDV